MDKIMVLGNDLLDAKVLAAVPDTTKIRNHLMTKGSITSLEAANLYGIMRLSAVIYKLRYKIEPLMDIKTKMEYGRDRFGQPSQYGVYYI